MSIERYKDVLVYYERLLQLLNKVTRNEASEAINQVLNALSGGGRGRVDEKIPFPEQGQEEVSEELKYLEQVYGMTLKTLKKGGYQARKQ